MHWVIWAWIWKNNSMAFSIIHCSRRLRSGAPSQVNIMTQNASKVESLLMSGQKNHFSWTVQLQNIILRRNARRKNNGPRLACHSVLPYQHLYKLQPTVWSPWNAVECMLIPYAVQVSTFRNKSNQIIRLTAQVYSCLTYCRLDVGILNWKDGGMESELLSVSPNLSSGWIHPEQSRAQDR